MIVLGLESSCDETAAAVVRDGNSILSNVVASQIDLHAVYGGVVPEIASRAHVTWFVPVLREAMEKAGLRLDEVDGIAVTKGPGLAGSLLVGVNLGKAVAYALDKPLVGVNHIEAHIYANWLSGITPQLPLLTLVVSGGHSDLLLVTEHGKYSLLGCTRDDAVGEAFDKVARILGLGYPGGPAIQGAAQEGDASRVRLPRAWLGKSYDFSFSGLKTAVLRLAQGKSGLSVADIAASFQESVVDVLVEKTRRAAEQYEVREVLLAGGVAANKALREEMVKRIPVTVRIPPINLCTDNAAMVAAAGYFRLKSGARDDLSLDVIPNLSLTPRTRSWRGRKHAS